MSSRSPVRSTFQLRGPILAFVALVFVAAIACCGAGYALIRRAVTPAQTSVPASALALTVAYSPDIEPTFTELASRFNQQQFKTAEGDKLTVLPVRLDPEAMNNAVLDGSAAFQAMTPDSSVWLEQLDDAWGKAKGSNAVVVGETVRYAVSPVVIATWESRAGQFGTGQQAVSWQALLSRARSDPNFRWSHPSTSSASGLLTVLAEFYAAANKTRGLTIEDVQAQSNLDYVGSLEKTVRYYGQGDEPALIQQALKEGPAFLDAFVVQEQMVVYFNQQRQGQERLVALYPAEGAMWQDHPLALLETTGLTSYQRQVFAKFRDYLLSSEAQQLILSRGFRPADYSIALDGAGSPLTAENGVDPSQPKTTLQVPSAGVIQVVHDVWWYTKRHTNVYLIADRSGSMQGAKLDAAKQALRTFLDQIQGDQERVGLIQFSSYVDTLVPLGELGSNRATLETAIDGLESSENTALIDAVTEAYQQLEGLGDSERINAIVVMTDGKENASYTSLSALVAQLRQTTPIQVVVFCVAYGDDADMGTLQSIAEPSGGQVLKGDPDTIRNLYKILSTYF